MMQPAPQEIEAKFSILNATQADYLCTTPTLTRSFVLGASVQVCHIDTYIDTAAFGLLRFGYALRIRHTPTGYRVTLKSLSQQTQSPIHRRVELEGPLDQGVTPLNLAHWPSMIRDFVVDLLGELPTLVPLCTLHQTRQKRMVWRKQGKAPEPSVPFAELSVDEVKVYPATFAHLQTEEATGDALGHPVADFWEAEAELQPGQAVTELEGLTHKLGQLRGLRPNRQSKLERALAELSYRVIADGQVKSYLQPTMHTADGCRLIWRQQLTQILLNEYGVRASDDPEYVHDMRVAVRRARVAMTLFRPYFRRRSLQHFRQALRTTGRKLGAVRDLDVALAKLNKFQKNNNAAAPEALTLLAEHWQAQRNQAFHDLLHWLDSETYTDFLVSFMHFCQTPGKSARHRHQGSRHPPQPVKVCHVFPSILLQRFERVRCYEDLFVEDVTIPATTLHQLRIECKYLRYLLEFSQHLLGPGGGRLIRALKVLQEHLGDLNDAVTSQNLIKNVPSATSIDVAQYQQEQQATIQQLSDVARTSLLAFIAVEKRRQLLQALVTL
jgi:CHAD domain-containing protein